MNGAESAVNLVTKLEDIGFEEFTTNIITSTFDAMLNAHIKQLETFIELVQDLAGGIEDFMNKYSNSITLKEIYEFIGFSLDEPITQSQLNYLKETYGEVSWKKIDNNLFEIEEKSVSTEETTQSGSQTTQEKLYKEDLLEEIKKNILIRRFYILENLVRQGLIRLVIDFGEIETKLLFSVYGISDQVSTQLSRQAEGKSFNIGGRIGGRIKFLGKTKGGLWGKIGGGYKDFKVNVKTTSVYDRDTTGSKVDIYARVYIRFKSDYLPLNPAEFGAQT